MVPTSWRHVDLEWWRRQAQGIDWPAVLATETGDTAAILRRCTYAGRPYGDQSFVEMLAERFGRRWERGRPRKKAACAPAASEQTDQFTLFAAQMADG